MEKGFEKSWRLILITMIIMPLFGILAGTFGFGQNVYLFGAIAEIVILIPTLIGVASIVRARAFDLEIFKRFSLTDVPVLLVLPFFMQSFYSILLAPFHSMLSGLMGEIPDIAVAETDFLMILLQILSVCIIPAIVEELFCRGVIMQMLKPYGIAVSMIISSILFALLHFDLYSFVMIFMMGMMLSAIKILTGSIWACIIVHFANNLTAIINNFFVVNDMLGLLVVLKLLSLVIFPLCLSILFKRHKENLIGIENDQKHKMKISFDVYACIFLFILNLVLTIVGQRG